MSNNVGYIVTRDGHKVSDNVYLDKNDSNLKYEFDHWTGISNKFQDGTKVKIVETIVRD